MRNHVVEDPSPRTPHISKQSNTANQIEAGYQTDGHQTWGYVLYRTTYESDADWIEVMRRLRYWTADVMEICNGQDALNHMTWTIFDDRARFDGADTATIRRHFREWAESAVQTEQPPQTSMGRSSRYRYCIQVDADSLRSIMDGPPPPPQPASVRQDYTRGLASA
jgi:hypothetical protein